ncbi:MAG TPA: M1 family aminopeptidase [Longimicrobiaceae bacterium]|nr:M1 family aminopeptidase [Longimicrobiaceae bacterium]
MKGPFLETMRFEVAYYLRRTSTWMYFLIFLALAGLLMMIGGGMWEGASLSFGGAGGNIKLNSPYSLAVLTSVVCLFGGIVTAALLGNSVYRDYEAGIHPLFFTSPITRFSYLGGRFTGALLVNALVMTSVPLGLLVGSVVPGLDRERFQAFRLDAFLHPYLVVVLPTLLFTGAIFFALAARTRQMLPNYIGGVVLVFGYLLAGTLMQDLENQRLAALLDPFAANPIDYVTRYWSPAQKNARLLPLEGVLLQNRLLWGGLGVAVFLAVYARFRFTHVAPERAARRRAAAAEAPAHAPPQRLALPTPSLHFDAGARWQQFAVVFRRAFWTVVGNRYFLAIVAAAALFLAIGSGQVGKIFGTTTWPVTWSVLEILGGTFSLFVLIIISFYAGELVWHERDVRMHQVHDAAPVPTWVPYAAKLAALAVVVALLQLVVLVTGVAVQAAKGYFNFELGLYLRFLFGAQLVNYLGLCVLVMLVHVLVNHKYLGHLIVILYVVANGFLPSLGLEHTLYRYNSGSLGEYSDMNRWGPFIEPFAWLKGYWAAWALLMAVLSNLFWVRGQETGARWRVRLARLRFRRPALAATAVAVLLIAGLGGFIFYNTNVLNEHRTGKEEQRARAEYEKRYKRFENAPQPRIVGASVQVDIFPAERDLRARGRFRLVNRSGVAVDSLHVAVPPTAEVRALAFDRPARRVLHDRERGYAIYRLAHPLAPGDSLRLDFDLDYVTRGFGNSVDNLFVVENGTFFHSTRLPSLGYNPAGELDSDDVRRRYGLRPKERMPRVTDPAARRNSYISRDADWIDFEATVSTSADQIALAPGYLQREWRQGGRRYFHYRMDAPILNFYSFLSARYTVKRDRWVGPDGRAVAIEVYHHAPHAYNLDRMIDAVKKSLDYFTAAFGPYQHRQVRILEFPRYEVFAQAFPNTIPYSEAIGFIARVDDEEDVDYPFYVTAHEVAHQWWAHQVIGAEAQGATLMSETLAQYSALMVMEREYGPAQMRKFLKYEMDRYFEGRSAEQKKEPPLLLDEGLGYVHYRKGSVAMYALRDYLGEARLNAAIRAFLEEWRFRGPPYPVSPDFYRHLQAATPDSLRYFLGDLFERITLYDNQAKSATWRRLPDGRYEVTLDVSAQKLYADSVGNERAAPMRDLVEVGVFAAAPRGRDRDEGEALYLRKHWLPAGTRQLRVVVDREPARAGVDPYHKLIDRHPDDNVVDVREAPR